MLGRNNQIKQYLKLVKFKFVAQSIAQVVAHGDGVARLAELTPKSGH